jgi:hypothetical protein
MTQGSETAQSKSEEVTISQYILTRLEQVRKDVVVHGAHKSKLSVLRSASGTSSEYQVSRHAASSEGHRLKGDASFFTGDFFLRFVDDIEDHPKVKWVGCTNEVFSCLTLFDIN